MPLLQRFLPAGILALVAALGCGAAGFVYAHEPARDQVAVTVNRDRPSSASTILGGTVTRTGEGRLIVEGAGGAADLALPANATVEELQSIAPSALTAGTSVNIGVERSDYGVALTGVVVVAGR